MRYGRFCDVDCDVTLLRIDQIDRFGAAARQCSTHPTRNTNAGEAPRFQELRRHPRSSPLAVSRTTRPIHTQEVTGSSPVAPTIQTNNLRPNPKVQAVPKGNAWRRQDSWDEYYCESSGMGWSSLFCMGRQQGCGCIRKRNSHPSVFFSNGMNGRKREGTVEIRRGRRTVRRCVGVGSRHRVATKARQQNPPERRASTRSVLEEGGTS